MQSWSTSCFLNNPRSFHESCPTQCFRRSLRLSYSTPELLWLASPAHLQSLMVSSEEHPVWTLATIKGLTELTSLQLTDLECVTVPELGPVFLQNLRRLCLQDCPDLTDPLLQPGCLPSPEEFHLHELDGALYQPVPQHTHFELREIARLENLIDSHPTLVKATGCSMYTTLRDTGVCPDHDSVATLLRPLSNHSSSAPSKVTNMF